MAFASNVSGAGTQAQVTLAARTDRVLLVRSIHWSLSLAPAAGILLTVASAGKNTYTEYVTAGGPGVLDFDVEPYEGADGVSVVVTLAAPGGSIVGTLNVFYGERD